LGLYGRKALLQASVRDCERFAPPEAETALKKASHTGDVSSRLARLREQVFGPRGRAALARAINLSPSTYNYYEKGRQPPADVLARVAEATGADLTWLLTGRGEPYPEPAAGGDTLLSPPAEKAFDRFDRHIPQHRSTPAARNAFRSLLADIEASAPSPERLWQPAAFTPTPTSIPILGRTAAGIPACWDAWFADEEQADTLGALLEAVESAPASRRLAEVTAPDPQVEAARPVDPTAELIQLASPSPEGVAEFLNVPGLGQVEPGTFALRVDGESMAPRIRDGDIVVSHRGAAPLPGHTAIVRRRGRIGVTVKLWRPEADRVHLIPIHASHDPDVFPLVEVVWACRVLWLVRL